MATKFWNCLRRINFEMRLCVATTRAVVNSLCGIGAPAAHRKAELDAEVRQFTALKRSRYIVVGLETRRKTVRKP